MFKAFQAWKNAIKILGLNLSIFFVLLYGFNLASVVGYQVYQQFQNIGREAGFVVDPRSQLPNYQGIEWAQQHFKEFEQTRTKYTSYLGWRLQSFKSKTINVDTNGIRATSQHELATEDSPLIVFLGGSTMWGIGVDDSHTIPSLFSQSAQGQYRVISFGDIGYRAFQSYLFLNSEINKGLKPDIVITYDGVNDSRAGLATVLQPTSHMAEYQIRYFEERYRTALSLRNLLIGQVESLVHKLRFGKAKGIYDFSDERTEQTARALLDSWMSIKALADRNGSEFVAVLQPNTGVGNPNLESLQLDVDALRTYKVLYPRVRELLKTPKYQTIAPNVIDLSNVLDGDEKFYIDDCHVSPNGNQVIAEKLLNYLNEVKLASSLTDVNASTEATPT